MATQEDLVLLLVVVIAIEGLWLAGLTYLMWRRAQQKKAAAPAEEPTKST